MARYVASIEIARPPKAVFDFIDTPENTPLYVEGTISCVQISGVRKGVGERVMRMMQVGRPTPIDGTQNVLEYVDGELVRCEGAVGWWLRYEATTRLERTESGSTRLTLDYVYRPTVFALLTVFFWPFFLLAMRGRIARMSETLKRVLESQGGGAYRAAG